MASPAASYGPELASTAVMATAPVAISMDPAANHFILRGGYLPFTAIVVDGPVADGKNFIALSKSDKVLALFLTGNRAKSYPLKDPSTLYRYAAPTP